MTSDLELPRLSSAELVSRFGNDQLALRRYRILVALLREGRPAGEVARTFGVSRESLRRLRQSFRRDGLAALQSQKRGGGHLFRNSPLAIALQQELRIEPGVSAPVLWRRVQARMSSLGISAPRSTFYRLLNQIRDDESGSTSAGQASVRLLRDALADLAEDPPMALAYSELAALLLPTERDMLQRGRRLHDALRAAIARLRPSEAGPVLDDPRWRHYLIIAGEYQTGEERAALQTALALSASTYSRAKREALERLVVLLPVVLGELPPLEPPATLIAPPAAPNVFDHEAELEQYMRRLRQVGLALIWGPSGAGKHDLAAMLAARLQARGQKVIWHSGRPPEMEGNAGLRLLQTLAAGLALEGYSELWSRLAAEPAALTQHLALLATGLAGRRWTVIVADTQWLTGDTAERVLDVLTVAQEQRDIRLTLVGRQLPGWADTERWPALAFPSDAAARRAFLARMSGETPVIPTAPPPPTMSNLRKRVVDLVAEIPIDLLDTLSPEQIHHILTTLHPIEALIAEFRAALPLAND